MRSSPGNLQRVVILVLKLGEKGRRIRELTSQVQKRFKFAENSVELYDERVNNRGLLIEQEAKGEKGRRIRELTSQVQKRFKFTENSVELYDERVNNRGLCAIAYAESLRYKLIKRNDHTADKYVVMNKLEDAHELIDTAISTALKESKPVYISIDCSLSSIPHPTFAREPVPFSLAPKMSNNMGLEATVEAAAEFLNKAVKPSEVSFLFFYQLLSV
ncbi:putative pyruvate decarboxylase [Helianthus annuus]|nr:putative pyruvate decarboxylase [Helianthus annuus]